MIILSGLLVVGAIALLVAGLVVSDQEVLGLHGLQLIYISIAVSIVSFLCLAIGVFLRRKELFGTAPARPAAPKSRQPGRAARQAAARTVEEPAERDEPTPLAFPMPSAQVPEDAIVHVVPGRKRYHLDTCRQLAGRQTEELTYIEAQEEGFSPCTACLPDTALAARATAGPADDGTSFASDEEPSAGTVHDASRPPGGDAAPEPGPGRRGAFGAEPFGEPFGGASPAREHRAGTADPWQAAAEPGPWQPAAEQRPPSAPLASPVEDTVTDWVPASFAPGPLDKGYPVDPAPAAEPWAGSAPADSPAEDASAGRGDGHWQRVVEPVAAEPVSRAEEPGRVLAEEAAPVEEAAPAEEHERAADGGTGRRPLVPAPAEAVEPDAAAEPEPAPLSVPESREPEPEPRSAEPEESGDTEGPLVRILSGTKRYHRPECALIEDIGEDDEDLESLPREEAKDRGCTPCLVCQPDKEPAV